MSQRFSFLVAGNPASLNHYSRGSMAAMVMFIVPPHAQIQIETLEHDAHFLVDVPPKPWSYFFDRGELSKLEEVVVGLVGQWFWQVQ